jgi:integrase
MNLKRGNLTVDDSMIQRILRHSNVSVTQTHYVKTGDADSAAAMKLLEAALYSNCAPASGPVTTAVVH